MFVNMKQQHNVCKLSSSVSFNQSDLNDECVEMRRFNDKIYSKLQFHAILDAVRVCTFGNTSQSIVWLYWHRQNIDFQLTLTGDRREI